MANEKEPGRAKVEMDKLTQAEDEGKTGKAQVETKERLAKAPSKRAYERFARGSAIHTRNVRSA